MKKNVKPATIARIVFLFVALVNQFLAIFGQGILPFTENMAYQIVSLLIVVITATINAWYNNDITKIALLCGSVYDALSDGKVTEEEIENILINAECTDCVEESKKNSFISNFISGIVKLLRPKN